MTSDKTRKRKARQLAVGTGQSYTAAARQLDAATPENLIEQVKGVAATTMPHPAATMVARHLRAAELHMARAKAIGRDNGAPFDDSLSRPEQNGPLEKASDQVWELLFYMKQWAERSAVASGVIETVPGFFDRTPAEIRAEKALYPGEHSWCHMPPGALPLPGEAREEAGDVPPRVRTSLTGPITSTRYVPPTVSGRNTIKVTAEVIAGTPAEPIWNAYQALNQWQCEWMDRAADTPQDLAAALDGLDRVARELRNTAEGVIGELQRRVKAGTLAGVDGVRLKEAADSLRGEEHPSGGWTYPDPLGDAVSKARAAVTGARAALPAGHRIPEQLAARMDGMTIGQVRHELGSERFLQRHKSKTGRDDYQRFDALEAVAQRMHHDNSTVFHAE